MKKAIQYVPGMSVKDSVSLGFGSFEVRYENIKVSEDIRDSISNGGGKIIGIVVNAAEGLEVERKTVQTLAAEVGTAQNEAVTGVKDKIFETLKSCMDKAIAYGADYIVIDTRGMKALGGLEEALLQVSEYAAGAEVRIYIENGYVCRGGVNYHTESSNASALCRFVEMLNKKAGNKNINGIDGDGQFGICVNVGYANLLGTNVGQFITDCEKHLAVMHMNDNNGINDQQQMPYTFTTGRGINSTDWYHIIGALYKLKFQGDIVFDTVGTFRRTPPELHGAMLELLEGIYHEWLDCFNIEERLAKPGKKIILFGAGKMAKNYMEAFGEKYPPVFLVDNNSKIWGEKRLGLEVKNPKAILEIPEEQRSVWICNMYYEAVALQLDRMGICYNYYFDNYYL